jgi:hypothetical protein
VTGAPVITSIYIDGFNLYYGCLRKFPQHRWPDLEVRCRKLLPHNDIRRMRSFTARIKPARNDLQGPARPSAYLTALGSLPTVSVHFGAFLASQVRMRLVNLPPPPASRSVLVHKM